MIEMKENLLFKGNNFSQVPPRKERADSEDLYDKNTLQTNNIFEHYDSEKSILLIQLTFFLRNIK